MSRPKSLLGLCHRSPVTVRPTDLPIRLSPNPRTTAFHQPLQEHNNFRPWHSSPGSHAQRRDVWEIAQIATRLRMPPHSERAKTRAAEGHIQVTVGTHHS